MMRLLAVICIASALLSSAAAQPAPTLAVHELTAQPLCALLDGANPTNDPDIAERVAIARNACRLPLPDIDAADAQAALGDQLIAVVRDGDAVTVFARTGGAQILPIGSLRGALQRLGQSEFAAGRWRLAELDRAIVSVFLPGVDDQPFLWRGPQAPPAPHFERDLIGDVVETTLYSAALGETRRLAIYLPPGHRANGDYPALFLADGSSGWVNYVARMMGPLIRDGALPPFVIVGSASEQINIVEDRSVLGNDIRSLDYVPNFRGDTVRFPAHMRFFSEELVALAMRDYGVTRDARRRVVAGNSASGAFAFWAGYLHPDVFGNAIVSSQAGGPVESIMPAPVRARFFMNAGLYEAGFLRASRRTAAALRAQGYEVVFDELVAGHQPDQAEMMFIDRLQRIF
jgi:enterochelin esterase-like enzyme